MKKLMLLIAALMAIVTVDAKPKQEASELNLRIGSYNVWSHSAREWQIKKGATTESRNWENSKKAVAKQIVDINCDILAMQEVTSVCRDDLAKLVKKWLPSLPKCLKVTCVK